MITVKISRKLYPLYIFAVALSGLGVVLTITTPPTYEMFVYAFLIGFLLTFIPTWIHIRTKRVIHDNIMTISMKWYDIVVVLLLVIPAALCFTQVIDLLRLGEPYISMLGPYLLGVSINAWLGIMHYRRRISIEVGRH